MMRRKVRRGGVIGFPELLWLPAALVVVLIGIGRALVATLRGTLRRTLRRTLETGTGERAVLVIHAQCHA